MNITNVQQLPEPLYKAVCNDEYSKGDADYSVTGLLSPPRIPVLKKKFDSVLVEDASARIWSLVGTLGHAILQKGAAGGDIVERRFFVTLRGKRISGQCDYSRGGILYDFKFTSVWTVKDGMVKPEHTAQLNFYRYLAAKNDVDIKELKIVAILRDWSVGDARRDPNYPQSQCIVLSAPVWDLSITEKFMVERIAMHEAAKTKLPDCSAEERWQKEDSYAIVKDGNKRAAKVVYTEEAAKSVLKELGGKYHVEFRPGESIRCNSYCVVAPHCEQWKKIQAAMPAKAEIEKETF